MKLTIVLAALAATTGVAAGSIALWVPLHLSLSTYANFPSYYDSACTELAVVKPAPGGQSQKHDKGGVNGAQSALFTDLSGLKCEQPWSGPSALCRCYWYQLLNGQIAWRISSGPPTDEEPSEVTNFPKVNQCVYYPKGVYWRAF